MSGVLGLVTGMVTARMGAGTQARASLRSPQALGTSAAHMRDSSASPLRVEVINFAQMEKLPRAPAPKGASDGFLLMTSARGGGPTCWPSAASSPSPLGPAPLLPSVSSHLPSLTSVQAGRRPRLTALTVGTIKGSSDNGDVVVPRARSPPALFPIAGGPSMLPGGRGPGGEGLVPWLRCRGGCGGLGCEGCWLAR